MPDEKENKENKALGEKVWESTREFFTRVKEDADKSIKILSLRSDVSRLRKEKNMLYTKLGEMAYEKIKLGSLKDSELKPKAEEITKIDKEIEVKERSIEKIKETMNAPVQEKEAPTKSTPKTPKAKAVKKSTPAKKTKPKKASSSKTAKSTKAAKSTKKKASK